MFDHDAIVNALFATYYMGVALSALGILYDTFLAIWMIKKEKSSNNNTKNYYVRFLIHISNFINYNLLLWYCTPIIFLDNYNLLALSCLGVLGESLFAVVAICYLGSRKKKLLVASLYTAAIVAVATVVTVACLLFDEIHARGKFVGTILSCFSVTTLLAVAYDLRVVFKKETAAELSVFSSVLGASGALNLCLYGILFHNKFIAIRHAVAFGGHVTILVVIGALYFSHHRRYRVGFSTILLVLRSTYWEYVRSKIPRAFVSRLALPAPPRPDVESSGQVEVEVELGAAPTPDINDPERAEAPVTMESLAREVANLRELYLSLRDELARIRDLLFIPDTELPSTSAPRPRPRPRLTTVSEIEEVPE